MTFPQPPGSSATGADGLPLEPPVEDELLDLITGPVGDPTTCDFCHQSIVRMRGGHYRLATEKLEEDRIICRQHPAKKAEEKRHKPVGMQPVPAPRAEMATSEFQAGDPS